MVGPVSRGILEQREGCEVALCACSVWTSAVVENVGQAALRDEVVLAALSEGEVLGRALEDACGYLGE